MYTEEQVQNVVIETTFYFLGWLEKACQGKGPTDEQMDELTLEISDLHEGGWKRFLED